MHMYLIKARPSAKSPYVRNTAGAFVNCWIDFKDSRAGQRLAEILIHDADWVLLSKRPKCWHFKGIRYVRPVDRPYYLEAKARGHSLVFNMWPISKRTRKE